MERIELSSNGLEPLILPLNYTLCRRRRKKGSSESAQKPKHLKGLLQGKTDSSWLYQLSLQGPEIFFSLNYIIDIIIYIIQSLYQTNLFPITSFKEKNKKTKKKKKRGQPTLFLLCGCHSSILFMQSPAILILCLLVGNRTR